MKTLAIEINDVGLRGHDGKDIVFDSPGYALVDGAVITGDDAVAQARLQPGRVFSRFWEDLSLEALPATLRGASTPADLAYHHLNALWRELASPPQRVILAVPGHYTREQLSLLLGITRELSIPVEGMVDLGLASAAQSRSGHQLLHVELMLHQVVLTRLAQGRRLRRERVQVVPDVGAINFLDTWAATAADALVRNTRYDPMHSADAEQQFYDRLPDWIADSKTEDSVRITVDSDDAEHTTVLRRQTMEQAAGPLYQQIARHIAAVSRPGEKLALLLSDRVQALPGIREALVQHCSGVELVELPPAAAAVGAWKRQDEIASDAESVAYVTSVRWDTSISPIAPPTTQRPEGQSRPTHAVLSGRAYRLSTVALNFGTEPLNGEKNVMLAGDTDGVSRHHFSLQVVDGKVELRDYSRHGTFINDQRTERDQPATVHCGDLVRPGNSMQIIQLVAEQADGG